MPFATFSLDELKQGTLHHAFAQGSPAAIIECGDLVEKLWSMLLSDPGEQLPWELPLLDIARNHRRGKDLPSTLGDVFYFQPGHHSYMARKIEIAPSAVPKALPDKFHQRDGEFSPSGELLSLCCLLVNKIMLALSPAEELTPHYKISVQRLKYQAQWEDFQALAELIEDSLARWGRFGYGVDVRRGQMPWARKGSSDLLGLLMSMPGARAVASLLRTSSSASQQQQRCPGRVYEHPHTDFRYFTGLCGSRQNVRTEVFVDGEWQELPVNLRAIAIYPGSMNWGGTALRPTIHRVVHSDTPVTDHGRSSNVTVLLGAV